MIAKRLVAAAAGAAALLVAGCQSGPSGIDVTRFHLGTPIAKGAIFLEPANPAQASDLEFQTYAGEVGRGLTGVGFTVVPALAQAEYVGVLTYGATTQVGPAKPPVTVGFGVGGGSWGYGGGGGGGVGVQTPVGGGSNLIPVNTLTLQIKRKSDQTMIWEGRAVSYAGPLSGAMPGLTAALLRDFPGAAGKTVNYKQ